MKKNIKNVFKLSTIDKKIKFLIFLIGIIISFSLLSLISIMQNNSTIHETKTFYEKTNITLNNNDKISDKEKFILPLINKLKNNNSLILIYLGGFSIIISVFLSIFIGTIIIKFVKNKSKNSNLEEPLSNFKEKLINLENENELLKKYYETEKDKNEILFSQIDKINQDFDNVNKSNLSKDEQSIEDLLDEILNGKNTENEQDTLLEKSSIFNTKSDLFEEGLNNKVIKQENNLFENHTKNNETEKNCDDSNIAISKTFNHSNSVDFITKLEKENLYVEIKGLCSQRKYTKALELCTTNLNHKEKRLPKFAYIIGYIYAKLGENRESKRFLISILSAKPENIEARNLFGVIQYRLGNRMDAIQQFKRVLMLDPDNKIAEGNLKIIKTKEKQQKEELQKIIA